MNIVFCVGVILAISGASVLWRKILIDFPILETQLQRWLGPIGYALICGFCYTYWLSLGAAITFGPLAVFTTTPVILAYGMTWMAIAFSAQTVRFVFIILQQLLVYFLHILNKDLPHKH